MKAFEAASYYIPKNCTDNPVTSGERREYRAYLLTGKQPSGEVVVEPNIPAQSAFRQSRTSLSLNRRVFRRGSKVTFFSTNSSNLNINALILKLCT